ncbi:hypothetical protein [Aquisphaera insulae]|uniref:hypothetical protein n=1 Tax=Aquisphaera insulae TaxID=2712864 RepID=UPI0013ECBFAA|nr:hypothetical protein [Aquisphaera insulae]
MRKSLLLLSAGLMLATAPSALADAPKTRAVLSLASHDRVKIGTDDVAFVKDTPGMPTWLSSLFELYAKGRDVGGLSHDRPWGAVVQGEDTLSGYGFVPVKDLDLLRDELSSYIQDVTDEGDGIYKVVGAEAGKQLFARERNGWLFVSDRAEVLRDVCSDPATLLDGQDARYDVAVRVSIKAIPEAEGRKILEDLDTTLGVAIRKKTSDRLVDLLGKVARDLDEVTLGWSRH